MPFLIPDQNRYLEIATALAARYGIDLAAEEIRRRALLWSQWHNGYSCRTARQFVEALRGELGLLSTSRRSRRRIPPGRARRPP